jgi:NAD(P)H-dependent FMN reductase
MGKLKLLIFLGSVREGRMGDRVLKFVQNQIDKNKFDVEIIGE